MIKARVKKDDMGKEGLEAARVLKVKVFKRARNCG